MKNETTKQVRILRKNPDCIKPAYVNDLIVTHSNNEFFITFSQIEHPAILTDDGLINFETIDSIAMSKIIVSPEFFQKMIEVLQTNYKNFLEKDQTESDS